MNLVEYNKYVDQCLTTETQISSIFFDTIVPKLFQEDNILLQREHREPLDRIGVDMLMLHGNRISYTDIKAHNAGTYPERRCNVALELETCYTSNLRTRYPGWFLSNKKVTDAYAFLLWTKGPTGPKDMRVRIIYRADIIGLLEQYGIDVFRWQDYTTMVPDFANGKKYWHLSSGIRIVESCQYLERPINLVLPWQLLSPLFIVDRDYHIYSQESYIA